MMEEFITERNLVEGIQLGFTKLTNLFKLASLLIGFVKGRGVPTELRTATVNDSTDRGGDREGDGGGGGADRGGNRQGDGRGGSSSGGRMRLKFGFRDCCMALKSNARTEES